MLPTDGDYFVRLCQFTYTAGNADYFYRLSISTARGLTRSSRQFSKSAKLHRSRLYGRNLPGGQPADGYTTDGRPLEKAVVSITPPARRGHEADQPARVDPTTALQDGFTYTLKGPGGSSRSLRDLPRPRQAHDQGETRIRPRKPPKR